MGTIQSPVAEAWNLDAIARRYRSFLPGVRRLRPTGPRACFMAVTRLVHRWRSFPFIDTQLPPEFPPDDWIGYRAARRFGGELHERWSLAAREWWRRALAESSTAVAQAVRLR